jgi:hypothetical protein
MSNTYYCLRGYDDKFQEDFWVGPFINMDTDTNTNTNTNTNTMDQYSGSIIRSNDYSSYYDPDKILSFDLYYFKTNRTQLQINKLDIINGKYNLVHINKFTGILDQNDTSLQFQLNNNNYRLVFNIKEEPITQKKLIMHPHLTIKFNNY